VSAVRQVGSGRPDDPRDAKQLCVACGGSFDAAAEVAAGRAEAVVDVVTATPVPERPEAIAAEAPTAAASPSSSNPNRPPVRRVWLAGGAVLLVLIATSAVVLLRGRYPSHTLSLAPVSTKATTASGLLGSGTWGIAGYASKWAEPFVQNLILWTLDGQPTESAPPPAAKPPQTAPAAPAPRQPRTEPRGR
jgi:hypothetical protein